MVAKTYDRQTAKFLAVVGENMPELSGDVMQGWIQNPKAVQKALSKAFCPPEATTSRFNIWKTIKLGTGLKTADDFRKSLKDNGFNIGDWANNILGKPSFKTVTEETEVDLVKVTVADLGFKKGARRDQIYDRAKDLGLELCPPEVGPQLRLQYRDQPNGEWALIGMELITGSGGGLGVFGVGCDYSGLWLIGGWGFPGGVWGPDCLWVFCLPRK
ncbi:MAG: hypothetical protein WC514_03200 [Candidatus Paceibacterota bacterium]